MIEIALIGLMSVMFVSNFLDKAEQANAEELGPDGEAQTEDDIVYPQAKRKSGEEKEP